MDKKKYKIGFEAVLDKNAKPGARQWLKPAAKLFDKAFHFTRLNNLINSIPEEEGYEALCEKIVSQFDLQHSGETRRQIPAEGPCIVVCNHPTGFAETALLPHMIFQVRKDVKILANEMLSSIPYINEYIIPIDVYDEKSQFAQVRQCAKWLATGGLLVVFPAGKVSDMDRAIGEPRDATWSDIWVRLAEKHKAQFVHVLIEARNSKLFYFVSRVKESIRPALFSREFSRRFNNKIGIAISEPVEVARLGEQKASDLTQYFYELNYALHDRPYFEHVPEADEQPHPDCDPLAALPDMAAVLADIEQLTDAHRLIERRSMVAYQATANEIPALLRYIQIKREATFRLSNMGTGEPLDGDQYDETATHVFVWDHKNQQLVGACRYQIASSIDQHTYLSETYEVEYQKIIKMGDMLDLSRTFLLTDYQKSFAGLLMLWRGLAKVVMQHSALRFMCGAISIPCDSLPDPLVDLIKIYADEMAYKMPHIVNCFTPKVPYLPRTQTPPQTVRAIHQCNSIAMLENVFQQLSAGRHKLPVLFRQYESLGLLTLKVSTDPDFSDCIDVLGVWDMSTAFSDKMRLFFEEDELVALRQRFKA